MNLEELLQTVKEKFGKRAKLVIYTDGSGALYRNWEAGTRGDFDLDFDSLNELAEKITHPNAKG